MRRGRAGAPYGAVSILLARLSNPWPPRGAGRGTLGVMTVVRFSTAGESHGPQVTTLLEGIPAGLGLARADVDRELARRQRGYGRGGRMKIEHDVVRFVGVSPRASCDLRRTTSEQLFWISSAQ